MSLSPFPIRPPGEPHAFVSPLRRGPAQTTLTLDARYADGIIGTLRNAIAAGASALDPILHTIAEAAQTLTGATGAALALRRDGVVVCCARSGDNAPDLGTIVSEDSGISGECLRTGKALRCDDTQKDYRVNPEVCRRLGLHAIALVPVRGQPVTAGILEVFSARAYAFTEEHIHLLERLAELAEAAQVKQRSIQPEVSGPRKPVEKRSALAVGSGLWTGANQAAMVSLSKRVFGESRSRYWIAGSALVAIIAVISVLGSGTRNKPPQEITAGAAAASSRVASSQVASSQIAPREDSTLAPATEAIPRPRPDRARERTRHAPAGRTSRRKPKAAPADDESPDVVTQIEIPPPKTAADSGPYARSGQQPAAAAPTPVQEPQPVTPVADQTVLASLLPAAPAVLPKAPVAVSQGITGGSPERTVQPAYPAQARAWRLEGAVVLEATIGEDGRVQNLKAVSGHPILVKAATEAVRQWRYHPFLLDGKPIARRTEITVKFHP